MTTWVKVKKDAPLVEAVLILARVGHITWTYGNNDESEIDCSIKFHLQDRTEISLTYSDFMSTDYVSIWINGTYDVKFKSPTIFGFYAQGFPRARDLRKILWSRKTSRSDQIAEKNMEILDLFVKEMSERKRDSWSVYNSV